MMTGFGGAAPVIGVCLLAMVLPGFIAICLGAARRLSAPAFLPAHGASRSNAANPLRLAA
jgi:hypothetical protein